MIAQQHDIEGLKEAGRRLGVILERLAGEVRPGITTLELDTLAEKWILEGADTASFKGYNPGGAPRGFPNACCISVNDEVVHGLPRAERILKEGDIVSLDLGLTHDGYVMDSALTVPVTKEGNGFDGKANTREIQELMATTEYALTQGIAAAKAGARIGDISHAVEESYKGTGFSVVKVLGGHGVGREVHEEPFIANYGHAGTGEEIVPGMVLALEPIATNGKASVLVAPDGFTYRTRDGSWAAHFEHTILVLENETIVLTKRPSEK